MGTFKNIEYKEVVYVNNPETGYFEKQPQRMTFAKLPFDLKVEETQIAAIRNNGADSILRGRQKNGKYLFFSGLIPTDDHCSFMANDYESRNGVKKNSLVVVQFVEDDLKMVLYYFNNYYLSPRAARFDFVNEFIEHKKRG